MTADRSPVSAAVLRAVGALPLEPISSRRPQVAADGQLDLAGMITDRVPLDRMTDGFEALRAGQGLQTIVTL